MDSIEINQEALNKLDKDFEKQIIDLVKSMQSQDSIEIGNAKTGVVKVYCDFSRPSEAEAKLTDAIKILKTKRSEVLE